MEVLLHKYSSRQSFILYGKLNRNLMNQVRRVLHEYMLALPYDINDCFPNLEPFPQSVSSEKYNHLNIKAFVKNENQCMLHKYSIYNIIISGMAHLRF